MPLHPFESRNKRLENALTVSALWAAIIGTFGFMIFAGGGSWMEFLQVNWQWLAAIPAGLVALVLYVRGAKAK